MADKNPPPAPPGPSPSVPSTSKDNSTITRIQRNVAEKQRRDKLNGYINELANIVPMVSMSSKRLDKTSILRLSAAHLRISRSPLGGIGKFKRSFKWCPDFLTESQIQHVLESVGGFIIITTSNGKILLVSRTVEQYLGHQNIDMIGHSLYSFVHPEDNDAVKEQIEKIFSSSMNGGSSLRCTFRCRLREKSQPRSEVVTYQLVQFSGDVSVNELDNGSGSKMVFHYMFEAFVNVVDISPYNQLLLEEAMADEYVTRHSLDGTIIFADNRLSPITGHMPYEVIGLSAYEYIHKDDITIAQFAQHLMFSSEKGTGIIVYRLRTRDDKYVYLKSVGYLHYDSSSNIDHFVCVNQYLNESDGAIQLKYFMDRYIPRIENNVKTSLLDSIKSLQSSKTQININKESQSSPSVSSHPENDLSTKLNVKSKNLNVENNDCEQDFSSSAVDASKSLLTGAKSSLTCTANESYFSKSLSSSNTDSAYTSSINPSTVAYNKCDNVTYTIMPTIDQSNQKCPDDTLKFFKKDSKVFTNSAIIPASSECAQFQNYATNQIVQNCNVDSKHAEVFNSTKLDAAEMSPHCNSSGSSVHLETSDSGDNGSDSILFKNATGSTTLCRSIDDTSSSTSSLSFFTHEDSENPVLKNSFWPTAQNSLDVRSVDVSNSSMDCGEDLYADKFECTLPFQDDLSSLLNPTQFNNEDISSSSDSRWNDMFGNIDSNMSFNVDILNKDKNS